MAKKDSPTSNPSNPEGSGERPRPRVSPPRRFRVMVFDDDETPGELVVCILGAVFGMHGTQAVNVTHEMARRGVAACGVFPHGIAETKALEVMAHAEAAGGYALKAEIEPA